MPMNGVGELIEHTRRKNPERKLRSRDALAKLAGVTAWRIRWLERSSVNFPTWGWKVIDALGIDRKLIRLMIEEQVEVNGKEVLQNGLTLRKLKAR